MSRIFLLLFAGLKFSKLFVTVGSMLLSLGVYALVFGWRYAAGFIALLFIHETGHLIAARVQFRGVQFDEHLAGLERIAFLCGNFFNAPTVPRRHAHLISLDRAGHRRIPISAARCQQNAQR